MMHITKEVTICMTPEDIVKKAIKGGWELLELAELCLEHEKEEYDSLRKQHLQHHLGFVKEHNKELIEYQLECIRGSRMVVENLEAMLKVVEIFHKALVRYHTARGYKGPWYWGEVKQDGR